MDDATSKPKFPPSLLSLVCSLQLVTVQQKLKNEEEEQSLISRINRLNDLRAGGTAKPKDVGSGAGGGGGTGLINTWKKLKGKKKKQRNLTAPEISTQDLKAVTPDDMHTTSTSTLAPVMESDKKEVGKGKTRFGGKKQVSKTISSPKDASPAAEIVFKNDMADSPMLSEDTNLGQTSPTFSHLSSSHTDRTTSEIDGTPPTTSAGSKSSDVIILEPLDLSQTSGKHSGASLSQPEPVTGINEHFSTQSSTEVEISSGLVETQQDWDNREVAKEDDVHYERGFFLQGSSRLYEDYGSKQHKLNLERVHTFLESSGETEAVDLSTLHDWDGWMIASREIM